MHTHSASTESRNSSTRCFCPLERLSVRNIECALRARNCQENTASSLQNGWSCAASFDYLRVMSPVRIPRFAQ